MAEFSEQVARLSDSLAKFAEGAVANGEEKLKRIADSEDRTDVLFAAMEEVHSKITYMWVVLERTEQRVAKPSSEQSDSELHELNVNFCFRELKQVRLKLYTFRVSTLSTEWNC